MKRFLNVLIAVVVYGVSCFTCSGLASIVWLWLIQHTKVAREFYGWGWFFFIAGFGYFLWTIGGLIIIGIYAGLYKGPSKIVAGISAITGLSSGIFAVTTGFCVTVITRLCDVDSFGVVFIIIIMMIIIAGLALAMCHWLYKWTKKQSIRLNSAQF